MTCERRYTASVIAEMQRIEDAARWDKLRQRLASAVTQWAEMEGTHRGRGRLGAYREVAKWLDELSPPVVCDSSE